MISNSLEREIVQEYRIFPLLNTPIAQFYTGGEVIV